MVVKASAVVIQAITARDIAEYKVKLHSVLGNTEADLHSTHTRQLNPHLPYYVTKGVDAEFTMVCMLS